MSPLPTGERGESVKMKGKYIYGIISSNGADIPVRGVYTISYNNLSAIVRDARLKTYEADEKGLLAHNKVLDKVMKHFSVLPMRFGTMAHSEGEVRDLLKNAYGVLSRGLFKIKDKVEFDMEILVIDEKPIIDDIISRNEEIRGLRDRLISEGNNVQMQDRLLIGKMIAGEVSRYKVDLLKDIDISLKQYYLVCKLIGKAGMNFAFLVSRSKINNFESTIYKIGERYGDRLKIKYAGPLAPYSFVELRLLLINFNTIDTARRQLGLAEEATPKDIKDSYRNLARQCHPDRNPGDKLKEEEFKKIASSYRLLCEYTRRYPKSRYVFKPEKIDEFSVLVEEE